MQAAPICLQRREVVAIYLRPTSYQVVLTPSATLRWDAIANNPRITATELNAAREDAMLKRRMIPPLINSLKGEIDLSTSSASARLEEWIWGGVTVQPSMLRGWSVCVSVCALMHLELEIYTCADSAARRLLCSRVAPCGRECQFLGGSFFVLSVIS
jgi:hypothetical protein